MEEVATEEGVAMQGWRRVWRFWQGSRPQHTQRSTFCNISCLCRRRSSLTLSSPPSPHVLLSPHPVSSNFLPILFLVGLNV